MCSSWRPPQPPTCCPSNCHLHAKGTFRWHLIQLIVSDSSSPVECWTAERRDPGLKLASKHTSRLENPFWNRLCMKPDLNERGFAPTVPFTATGRCCTPSRWRACFRTRRRSSTRSCASIPTWSCSSSSGSWTSPLAFRPTPIWLSLSRTVSRAKGPSSRTGTRPTGPTIRPSLKRFATPNSDSGAESFTTRGSISVEKSKVPDNLQT